MKGVYYNLDGHLLTLLDDLKRRDPKRYHKAMRMARNGLQTQRQLDEFVYLITRYGSYNEMQWSSLIYAARKKFGRPDFSVRTGRRPKSARDVIIITDSRKKSPRRFKPHSKRRRFYPKRRAPRPQGPAPSALRSARDAVKRYGPYKRKGGGKTWITVRRDAEGKAKELRKFSTKALVRMWYQADTRGNHELARLIERELDRRGDRIA